jgi:hypothetical protein
MASDERFALVKPSWWTRTRELRRAVSEGADAQDGEVVGRLHLRGLVRWSGLVEVEGRRWFLRGGERAGIRVVDAQTEQEVGKLVRRSRRERVLTLPDGGQLLWGRLADRQTGFALPNGAPVARFAQRRVLRDGPITVEVSANSPFPAPLLALLGGYLMVRAAQRGAAEAAGVGAGASG